MFPYALRSFYESLLKAAQANVEQERQRGFAREGFNITSLPLVKPKKYKKPRVVDELNYIIGHVTAVKGGFGVSKRAIKKWTDKLRGHSPGGVRSTGLPELDLQLSQEGVWKPKGLGTYEFEGPLQELARRLALWERYRASVPYHQIGAANGDNVANRDLHEVTWHANAGNFGVGWALDIGAKEELSSWHVETGRASFETLYYRVLSNSALAKREGVFYAPHAAFSGSRVNDTGPNVHREIVIPLAKKLDGLHIDYTIRKNGGRPLLDLWDLYDKRGRKL